MTKTIPLSQGKVTLVDDEDYDWLNQWKWCADAGKNNIMYAIRKENIGRIDGKYKRKKIRLHRAIIGAKKGEIVDHINGDGLDNRKTNLRIVTHRQNCQNLHINKTSEYPGVSFDRSKRKWAAHIRINKKTKFLGNFNSEIEAFNTYKRAVHELIGEKVVCEIES